MWLCPHFEFWLATMEFLQASTYVHITIILGKLLLYNGGILVDL